MAESSTKQHSKHSSGKLNRLRAAVLGADDGIVSVSGIIAGVAGASNSRSVLFTAGIAGLFAGALSMAAGEFVSVSSQRDTERALLENERIELRDDPATKQTELADIYRAKGLSESTAQLVASELTQHNAFAAHADAELGINPDTLTSPWQAALASAVSFVSGAMIPILAVVIAPVNYRLVIGFLSVIAALAITGVLSAMAGGAHKIRATIRVLLGGILAMVVTYGIGKIVGTHFF